MLTKSCLICSKEFKIYPSLTKKKNGKEQGKFCSMPCYRKYRTTIPAWNKGKLAPWSVGNKFRLGKKNPNAHFKQQPPKDEKNVNWKGDDVGYVGLHGWVRRRLGEPNECKICGNKNLRHRQYHWANISKRYFRDESDWIRLCVKCHKEFDSVK